MRSAHRWAVPLSLACGLTALAARPVATDAVAVTAMVGVAGVAGSVPRRATGVDARRAARWLGAVLLGVAAFAASTRLGPAVPTPVTTWGLGASLLAALAEEAFFRGLLQGWAARWGGEAVAAVLGAVSFAAVHVPAYGLAVLPLNLAAGLLLGWQRSVTGGWSGPAVTHAVANLLQVRLP